MRQQLDETLASTQKARVQSSLHTSESARAHCDLQAALKNEAKLKTQVSKLKLQLLQAEKALAEANQKLVKELECSRSVDEV